MDLSYLLSISIPLVIAAIGYLMKTHLDRINDIEKRVHLSVTEEELRAILADKVDPLREDIREVKDHLAHITKIILDDRK